MVQVVQGGQGSVPGGGVNVLAQGACVCVCCNPTRVGGKADLGMRLQCIQRVGSGGRQVVQSQVCVLHKSSAGVN